jgi:hydrogenase maturation protein HypF
VLIHMGFAMEVIDESQAREALSGLELMGRPMTEPAADPGEG